MKTFYRYALVLVGEHQKRVSRIDVEYVTHTLWDDYLTLFADLHRSDKFALRHFHFIHSPFRFKVILVILFLLIILIPLFRKFVNTFCYKRCKYFLIFVLRYNNIFALTAPQHKIKQILGNTSQDIDLSFLLC